MRYYSDMIENNNGGLPGAPKKKLPRLVGNFIRQRREALNISQRALGQLFTPPVTTQFISNVERGVTPFPPSHVPTLAKVLQTSEKEIMGIMEQEYAQRLSGKLGVDAAGSGEGAYFAQLAAAYRAATEDQRRAFRQAVKTALPHFKGDE